MEVLIMDFLDSLDQAMNKAKDVFDVACKKTGEVVNTQKQKFDVSTLKTNVKKISNNSAKSILR